MQLPIISTAIPANSTTNLSVFVPPGSSGRIILDGFFITTLCTSLPFLEHKNPRGAYSPGTIHIYYILFKK